ncbi:MAG: hypothetical protein ACTSWQ_07445 [Candidatus Thorarchaeota archaeon]
MAERQELLAEAEELGLKFAKNIGTDKLQSMIEDEYLRLADKPDEAEKAPNMEDMRKQIEAEMEAKFALRLEEAKTQMEENINDRVQANLPIGQRRIAAIKKATKLVRCVITTRDPAKQNWEGEIISAANDLVGDQKKYVPFNLDEGYHLPQIIVNVLKDKKCSIFITKKGRDGQKVKVGKQISAYNVEILPPLTQGELDELGADQRARHSLED